MNKIKSPLDARIFRQIFHTNEEFKCLLLHTQVRLFFIGNLTHFDDFLKIYF